MCRRRRPTSPPARLAAPPPARARPRRGEVRRRAATSSVKPRPPWKRPSRCGLAPRSAATTHARAAAGRSTSSAAGRADGAALKGYCAKVTERLTSLGGWGGSNISKWPLSSSHKAAILCLMKLRLDLLEHLTDQDIDRKSTRLNSSH